MSQAQAREDWPFLGLLFVVFLAPFERVEPLLRLPHQNLTNLEIFAAGALLIWLWSLRRGGFSRLATSFVISGILLLLFCLFSSLLVARDEGVALRYTGRLLLGFMMAVMATDVLSGRERIRAVVATLTVSGTIVGLLGILEFLHAPGIDGLLKAFRPTGFYVAGQTRVAATLQYPTITSMYLELTLAWGLALFLESRQGTSRRLKWILFGALTVMATGIFLTVTRAGVAVVFAILATATALEFRQRGLSRETKRLLSLGGVVALVFVVLMGRTELALRLTVPDEDEWYGAVYGVPATLEIEAGALREVEVRLENRGLVTWNIEGASPVRLGYHWLKAGSDEVVVFEGIRTSLLREVEPGGALRVRARVLAPSRPGNYRLAWDMLKEYRFWFSMLGEEMPMTSVEVTLPQRPPLTSELDEQTPLPHRRFSTDRWTLWRAAAVLLRNHPWQGIGPDNFRLTYGEVLGLSVFDRSYHSHNLFLEFFVSLGVFGGLLFVWVFLVLPLRAVVRLFRRRPSTPLAVAALTALVAIALHGAVDAFLGFTPAGLMIWASLGMIIALGVCEGGSREG